MRMLSDVRSHGDIPACDMLGSCSLHRFRYCSEFVALWSLHVRQVDSVYPCATPCCLSKRCAVEHEVRSEAAHRYIPVRSTRGTYGNPRAFKFRRAGVAWRHLLHCLKIKTYLPSCPLAAGVSRTQFPNAASGRYLPFKISHTR